ncbi:MAG: class I SAM-dependent methyltransferase [Candidatus Riflebacteria bacterium]|nr:class I SAM-dependent methyltransferase [Candidatus Riflebacteria bacterium]
MPVTGGKGVVELSQRGQYALGGIGRQYWDFRDNATLGYITGRRILDAGCGEGITLGRLVERFPDKKIMGVDVDPKNISICKHHGLPVLNAHLQALPLMDEAFDSIILMEVIEHLETPRKILKELFRVLAPGGRLIIVFPNDMGMMMARLVCLRWREAFFDPCHLRQWGFRTLSKLLYECGFSVAHTRSIPLFIPFMLHGIIVAERKKVS